MAREHPDLELDNEHPDNPRAFYLQRAGWGAMLLFVLAAAAGLFGAGPAANARIEAAGLELSYARFQRMTTSSELTVTVPGSAGDITRIWLDRDYASRFQITAITPQPESATSTRDKLIFAFRRIPGEPLAVTFHLTSNPGTFGRLTGTLGADGAGEVEFSQFLWP